MGAAAFSHLLTPSHTFSHLLTPSSPRAAAGESARFGIGKRGDLEPWLRCICSPVTAESTSKHWDICIFLRAMTASTALSVRVENKLTRRSWSDACTHTH